MLNVRRSQLRLRGRRKGEGEERGAALVEAALIFPLLMFMIFGIIELGSLLSTHSAVANAARAGGRMASVQGSDITADQETIARIAQESTAIRNGEIQFIIIWHAAGPDSVVPANCISIAESLGAANTSSQGVRNTSGPGSCNIYARPQAAGGAFQMARGELANPPDYYFGCSGPSGPGAGNKLDCNWPAIDRNTVISPRVLPTGTPESARLSPDHIGVYIRVEYRYLTGILGATREINDNSITVIEPSNFGVG